MSRNPESGFLYPDPPRRLSTVTIRSAIAFVGPGVIIASVTIGSGELVFASRSGAVFSYQLLWVFLLAGLFKGVQVFTAARHMTLTGEHPMVSWKAIPGPPLWFPLLIALPTLAVMPIAFSGISEILGGYVGELTGWTSKDQVGPFEGFEFSENVWASIVLTACLMLAIRSTLTTLERISAVVLGLVVLCVLGSVIVCRPSLAQIIMGLLVPRVPEYAPWVMTEYSSSFAARSPWLEVALYLTAVGGGTFDYVGYVGLLREKKWGLAGRNVASREQLEAVFAASTGAEEIRRAQTWTRASLLDTGFSFAFVILVTLLFAILGARVLHTQHTIPDNQTLLSDQEQFLTVLHPQLRWVYRSGVFLAFIGTLYGAFEIYQHTFLESARAIVPRLATERHLGGWRRFTVAYCYVGGMILLWLPRVFAGNVIERMTFGAIISGATLCGLWCFAMLWIDFVRLPPPLRMGRMLWSSTFVAGAVMTGLGVQSLIAYFS